MEIRQILAEMKARGWSPACGASPGEIRQIETRFGVALPEDYRHYLAEAGGGDTTAPHAYTALWPTRTILALNAQYRIPWNFPGLMGIGNDGFLVYAFDFREAALTVVSLAVSSSAWDDVVIEADTFSEWLERRLPKR